MVKKSDKKRIKKTEENLEAVESVLTRSEMWLEKNSKMLTIVVLAIVVVALGFFGYYRFIQQPRVERAQSEMFMAEKHFGESEYQKALDGDENHAGFLEIIDNYGSTKPGKLAAYYAGICYLNLKDWDNAITYLKKYNGKDEFLPAFAAGAIGDAYLELGDTKAALAQYEKAAGVRTNNVTTPTFLLKAGLVHEMGKNYAEAKKTYERIRKEYPNSNEAREVEKTIPRVEAKMAN